MPTIVSLLSANDKTMQEFHDMRAKDQEHLNQIKAFIKHEILIENAIRPVALGCKNYLFAGSHEAAQRSAMIYSFFAICKKHEVNPYQWLKYTLLNIASINHKNIKDLYPQNYKQIIDKSNT